MSNLINTSSNAVKLDSNIQSNNNILNFPNKKNISSRRDNTTKGSNKTGESTEVYPFTLEDTIKISSVLSQRSNPRDYTIFILGINTGLRCGDILNIKWEQILNRYTGEIESSLTLFEEKTNKKRTIEFNPKVMDALESLYLYECYQTNPNSTPSGYLFKSQKNNKLKKDSNIKRINLTVDYVRKMLKEVSLSIGITYEVGTHSMRKSWGKRFMEIYKDDPLALYKLQKLLRHSNPEVTLRYIGMQKEIDKEVYNNIILG
jgi:integrase